MSTSNIKTILGTMEFGRRLNLEESEAMTNAFFNLQKDVSAVELDAAFMYAGGKTEQFIGQMDVRLQQKVQIATKANPWENKLLDETGIRYQLETSLKRLNLDCVQIFYLHAPDHKTPIFETLKAVNDLYQEKKFKEFGLSNYAAWEVAEICTICKNQGWIQPSVYQGMYSSLTRSVEKELFPCLRHFNIRFYAYSPLCGGMLTGKHKIEDANKTDPGRFFGKGWAEVYRKRYWKTEIFDSISKIDKVLHKVYGDKVSITEASLRWIFHHSKLNSVYGDGVILGASNMQHLDINVKCSREGPLVEDVVETFDKCWNDCCYLCPDYMR